MPSTSIDFPQLTKRHGSVTALDGLSAELPAGRVRAFLGANGAHSADEAIVVDHGD